jgi:heme-degrading monooxygenase HmoA
MNELTITELDSIEGYLGYKAFRDEKGFGVNVSYWKDMEALKNWRDNILHQKAQELGKEKWYTNYKLRICTVVRDY